MNRDDWVQGEDGRMHCPCHFGAEKKLAAVTAERDLHIKYGQEARAKWCATECKDKIAALDAERYRWLRSSDTSLDWTPEKPMREVQAIVSPSYKREGRK